MAAMQDANGMHIFGLANSHDQNAVGSSQFSIIWRVEIDPATGDPMTSSTAFKNKLLVVDSSKWHADNQFIGMRSEMELDGSGVYWIHCVFIASDRSTFYMRATPETAVQAKRQRIQVGSGGLLGYSAVFQGASSGMIGDTNSFTGYQAYIVGALQDYFVYPGGGALKDFGVDSYGIWVTIEDGNFCSE